MLHRFAGPEQFGAFEQAAGSAAGKTISAGAACYALRVPLERLYALVEEDALDAWAFYDGSGAHAAHYRLSAASVVACGIRRGLFRSAEDASHLLTAEEYAALAGQERDRAGGGGAAT